MRPSQANCRPRLRTMMKSFVAPVLLLLLLLVVLRPASSCTHGSVTALARSLVPGEMRRHHHHHQSRSFLEKVRRHEAHPREAWEDPPAKGEACCLCIHTSDPYILICTPTVPSRLHPRSNTSHAAAVKPTSSTQRLQTIPRRGSRGMMRVARADVYLSLVCGEPFRSSSFFIVARVNCYRRAFVEITRRPSSFPKFWKQPAAYKPSQRFPFL